MNANLVGVSLATCGNFEDSYLDDVIESSSSKGTIAIQPGPISKTIPLTPDYFLLETTQTTNSDALVELVYDKHSVLIDMRHIRQLQTWDCGVACVQMVLSYIGYQYTARELLDMVDTSSVWTIDLAFLLRRSCPELCFLFCSTTLKVEESYSQLEMYQKEFDNDSVRCQKLFMSARDSGVSCSEVSLDKSELGKLMLTRRVLLIVLVDITKIETSRYPVNSRYTGHYLVIVGYDSVTKTFSYLDPAQTSTVRTVSGNGLDRARCCEGTDQDLIIIQIPHDANQSDRPLPLNGLDRLEGWRRSAFEVSDNFFDSADTLYNSVINGISHGFGRHEDPDGNELKIL